MCMGCVRTGRTAIQELNIDWNKAFKELNPNCSFIQFDTERIFRLLMIPEETSKWYGGKYEFSFTIPDLYPERNILVKCLTDVIECI